MRFVRHPRWLWWSLMNWLRGYKFGPIQRCRRCEHTTPYHYDWCDVEYRKATAHG